MSIVEDRTRSLTEVRELDQETTPRLRLGIMVNHAARWTSDSSVNVTVTVTGDLGEIRRLQNAVWFRPLISRLVPLLDLGWNRSSHDYAAVDLGTVSRGIEPLLAILHPDTEPPEVFPTSCGGINLEWSRSEFSVDFSVNPGEQPSLSFTDASHDWDGPPEDAPEFVLRALTALAAR